MFSKVINKSLFVICAFAIVLFISCKEEKKEASTTESAETPAQTINNTQNNSTNNNGEVALNPAHGQPGHRCDIQVGQPLPSGNAEKSSPVINSSQKSPVINNTGSVPVNNSNSTAKVNPAHGQPGHRCDIPVGSPL